MRAGNQGEIWLRLRKVKVKSFSRVRLFATPWTVAYQAPPSMGFSRQEYQSGLPFPSPGDLPDPGIKPGSLALQADSLPSDPSNICLPKVFHTPPQPGLACFSSLGNYFQLHYLDALFLEC